MIDSGGSEKADKTQIGTSELAKDLMRRPPMSSYFQLEKDAIKFAVAFALSRNLEPVTDEPSIVNAQHVAGLDEDSHLKFLLERYKKSKTPYRLAEQLAEAGFREIHRLLAENEMFEDLLSGEIS